jgi:prepilin peptidase CpaA
MVFDALILIVFPAAMAYAAASDLFTMTISNRVSLLLVAGFVIVAPASGLSLSDIGLHFAAGFLVLACTFIMFARGWIGGGDAKLAAAIALWFGFTHMTEFLLLAAMFGGWLTLGLLEMRNNPLPSFLERQPWAIKLHRVDTGIPYGIALAGAALLVYPSTIFMTLALR